MYCYAIEEYEGLPGRIKFGGLVDQSRSPIPGHHPCTAHLFSTLQEEVNFNYSTDSRQGFITSCTKESSVASLCEDGLPLTNNVIGVLQVLVLPESHVGLA